MISGSKSNNIIVVSGLPRSGTSMMMAMLQAGGLPLLTDNVRSPDDDNLKGYFEYERIKALKLGDNAWMDEACGRVVKIISYLLFFLPDGYEYKIIFMQRRISEILASQRQMLIRRGENANKTPDHEIEVILQNHLRQVDTWLEQKTTHQAIKIDYNELLENPQKGIQCVPQFLEVDLDLERMLDVIDPDLYRQRE